MRWLLLFASFFVFAGLARAARDPLDERVTVRVRDVPLGVYLATISSQSDVSFVISDEVEYHHVTASLGNVTVREALDLLAWQGVTYFPLPRNGRYIVRKQ